MDENCKVNDCQQRLLRAENAKLREALQFYATAVVATSAPDSPGHCDDGGFARCILEQLTKGNDQ